MKCIWEIPSDVSLTVNRGEFFGIIGRNGSGKSTLLKIIARVLEPTSGRISASADVAPFLELGVGSQADSTVKQHWGVKENENGIQKPL